MVIILMSDKKYHQRILILASPASALTHEKISNKLWHCVKKYLASYFFILEGIYFTGKKNCWGENNPVGC
jgi:hypothetical protein